MLYTIIVFLFILSVIVLAHEWGHYWVARRFGVKPEEFGLGFPPRAFGIYKDMEGKWKKVRGSGEVDDASDTIYSINWFPLGGFVKLGEDDVAGDDPNHFNNKAVWKKTAIILAGVTMNVILAFVLISFGFMIGFPQALDGVGEKAIIADNKIQIIEVLKDSPAEKVGLKAGDYILAVNENEFTRYTDLQNYVKENVGNELVYKVEKNGRPEEIMVTPEVLDFNDGKQEGIGVAILETGLVRYPFFSAIKEGFMTTIYLFVAIVVAFYNLIKDLVIGAGVQVEIAGPVGIASITGTAARLGLAHILQFAAVLSINLAIINALPFPALDGGRVLFLGIEKIKGKPVRKEIEALIHNIGFILLMILVLLVTISDVSKITFVSNLWGRIVNIF